MTLIREQDEFTWDMVRGLPRANFLAQNNRPVTVECKPGLSSIYKLVTPNVKEVPGKFREGGQRETYNLVAPRFTRDSWLPPNLREKFLRGRLSKPVAVIQNKYTKEWLRPPVNYFPKDVLRNMLKKLLVNYDVIYIRPRKNTPLYYEDLNEMLEFSDYEMIKTEFPQVTTIYDLIQETGLDYNLAQFQAHARADKHISVSGGNACIAAYFGGELIIYDSPKGKSGRGIWKTNSWLTKLSGSKIIGVNDYDKMLGVL